MSAKHTVKSFFTFKWNPCKLATVVVKETGGKTYTATGVAILTSEQLSGYDTVYFGFPVWWSDYLSIRGGKVANSKQEVVDWVAKVSK